MNIYLPIAELSVNIFVLLGIGGGIGFLSGLFGVGGGFLLTPLLILLGIPPTVAVASGANQIAASSISGLMNHWRRGNVDFKMGLMLVLGGLAGSGLGVGLFTVLHRFGHLDLAIGLAYVLLLGTLGAMMLIEGARSVLRRRRHSTRRMRLHQHYWLHRLPLKMRFRKSRLYISAILPVALGGFAGMLTAIMGVGGGFLLVPAMVYLIGMPTAVVVGTSLLQITAISVVVTFLQATSNQNVDLILALLLILGGVLGAQVGARAGSHIRGDQLRLLLGLIVLAVCAEVTYQLFATPEQLFSLALRPYL